MLTMNFLLSIIVHSVPVRVTNRDQPSQRQPMMSHLNNASHRNTASFSSSSQKRTLLIGDSTLTGINYRGLKNDAKICARSGGSIKHMWDEISVYDMKSFAQIIICVGGNDCSSEMDTHVFEDSYDKHVSLIKSANKDCFIYLSKVVP